MLYLNSIKTIFNTRLYDPTNFNNNAFNVSVDFFIFVGDNNK